MAGLPNIDWMLQSEYELCMSMCQCKIDTEGAVLRLYIDLEPPMLVKLLAFTLAMFDRAPTKARSGKKSSFCFLIQRLNKVSVSRIVDTKQYVPAPRPFEWYIGSHRKMVIHGSFTSRPAVVYHKLPLFWSYQSDSQMLLYPIHDVQETA